MREMITRAFWIGMVCVFCAGSAIAQEVEYLESRPLEISIPVLFPPVAQTLPSLLTGQTMSERGIEVLKVFESFSPKAYRDGRGYSIGYGVQTWQGRRVTRKYPGRVTIEEAEAEMRRQIPIYEEIVQELVGMEVPQEVFDAFVSIAYNLGRVNNAILVKLDQELPVTVKDFLTTARYRGRVSWKLQGRRTREFLMALGEYEKAMDSHASRKEVRLAMQALNQRKLYIFED